MNIYKKNQNILFENIKKSLNIAIYQDVKYKLNSLIKDNLEENEIIKKIINLIKQPQQLLNLDSQVRYDFCKSPKINHEIFESLNINRKIIVKNIQSIGNNSQLYKELLEQYNLYSKSQYKFCKKLVKTLNQKSNEKPLELLNELPLLFNEKFEKFEIISSQLAYEMVSYDPIQFKYIRKNETGLSIGTVINDVYFKYDKGGRLLNPAKEFAIYQLFKDIFPLASSTFVAPTQLIIIDNLKILNEESKTIKKLGFLKTQHDLQDVKKILEIEPEFRAELNSDLKNCQPFFIQTSLFTKGQTFLNFLNNKDINYTQIDMESYSSHIIISLLVIHSDYKPDNLILEEGTNKIIGIDNDQCLDYNEINHENNSYFTHIRNILYTMQPLMLKPIDRCVKEQFIQKDPFITIFKWLLQLESKQIEYEKLFQFLYEFKEFMDDSDKQNILKNTRTDLNLPIIFRKNWIPSMAQRFITIKELLQRSQSTNHQELFNSIHPLSSEYYNKLSIKHNNDPIKIMESIYGVPIDDDILNKYNNFREYEYQPDIKESILELIKYKNYNENEDSQIFYKWSKLIFNYLSENQIKDFQFHESWYINKISILFKIIKYKTSQNLLKNIISRLNIIETHQVFSFILNNQLNQNVCDNIEFLFSELKMDINILEYNYNLLELALNNKNFKLFIIFLKLGSNKSIDENKFNDFYQTLSHEQKLELKPYLLKLFNINNKINWKTSINQIFPKTNALSDQNINSKIISTINGDKRIISDKYWNQLFSPKQKPKKCNQYGSRSVVFIEDEYGNGIYVKFYPQLPGTEIAINKLSELLFGFLTPICELASINNIPILLIQEIPGYTLIDALKKDKDIINKIESSNLSKQLVFAMISNNGDGNLANFIIVPNENSSESYNIYSIDNDQSFMPPISKSIDIIKKSIQVETILLLFNQMNDNVHQNVINCIKNVDINKLMENWLVYLIPQHECAIEHFNKIKLEKDKETIIGISFNHGLISQLYSKLKRLQQMIIDMNDNFLTHMDILETIEPLISDRIKPIISSNLTLIDKYSKLKKLSSFSEKSITCSTHPSVHLLESRLIPNSNNIRNQLLNGKYGPSQALEELKLLNVKKLRLEELVKNIIDVNHKYIYISNFDFECLLESDSKNIKENSSLNKLYEFIKIKEPSIINLRDNQNLNIQTIIQFNLDTIVKLDLSGCKMLKSITSYITSKLFFKCIIKLILNDCDQLNTIKIKAPVLKYLNASNCKSLKILDIDSPNIINLNLKRSISKKYINISKIIKNFKKIEYLNISGADYDSISIKSNCLKCLNINSMKILKEAILDLPSIEAINIDGCLKLDVIQSIQENVSWIIPKALYNPSLTFDFKIIIYPFEFFYQKMSLNPLRSTPLFKSMIFINSLFPISPGTIPSSVQSLTFGNDFNQPLSPGTIPSSVQSLTFGHKFNQPLSPDTIPSSVQSLEFGYYFNQPLSIGIIPSSVQSLTFGSFFNQLLSPGIIPSSVQSLTFGSYFNQPLSLGTIPSSVQSLEFGYYFNQPLSPGIIPSSVQSLTFNDLFNQPLSHDTIPSSVQSLFFGKGYAATLSPGIIPSSVQSLKFSCNFEKPLLLDIIPSSVQSLTFGKNFNQTLSPGIIPSSVQSLTFGYYFIQPLSPGIIPSSVQSLEFGYWFNQPLSPDTIPSSVQSLTFGGLFNQPLSPGIIPSSVQSLTFGNYFNQPLSPGIIPSSVESLTFGRYFNQLLSPGSIPSSVQSLTFGDDFNQPLSLGTIPSSVQSLTFGFYFNQPLSPGSIPSSVQSLTFGYCFNQPLSPGIIPSNVQSLTFGDDFNQPLSPGIIPSSVQSLIFDNGFF